MSIHFPKILGSGTPPPWYLNLFGYPITIVWNKEEGWWWGVDTATE